MTSENTLSHDNQGAGGMVDIHDRRPVPLSPELAREWLDPVTLKERAEQMLLTRSDSTDVFEWFKVSKNMGNVRNQGAELVVPLLTTEFLDVSR